MKVGNTLFWIASAIAADRLQQHGDPWRLSEELPDKTGKGYSTPPQ